MDSRVQAWHPMLDHRQRQDRDVREAVSFVFDVVVS
jgi:hypothetical protein